MALLISCSLERLLPGCAICMKVGVAVVSSSGLCLGPLGAFGGGS